MQPWEIAARIEIRALVDKNAVLYDLDRFEDAYSVFAEDGVLEPAPGMQVRRGRADILSRFALRPDGRLGDYGWVRHMITSHHLDELTETAATGYTYWLAWCDGEVSTLGCYVDRFVHADGAWWIAHRSVRQDLTARPAPDHL